MGLFKKIKGKTSSGAGRWLPPDFIGNVIVGRCFTKESEKKKGKEMFIAELRVLSTNMEEKVPIGSKRSYIVTYNSDWPDLFLGSCNEFNFAVRCSAAEIREEDLPVLDELGEAEMEELISEEQPFQGVVLRCETTEKDKVQSDGKFTIHSWSTPKDLATWYEKAEELEAA